MAYGARRADGMPMLWVQDLSSGEARVLEGTEGAALPFWSPDSRDVGFFAGFSLKRVPAAGGPVQVVSAGVRGAGGAWAADHTIVFGADDAELLRVSEAAGSTSAPLTKLPGTDWTHAWPSFLPDGRRFLLTAKHWTSAAESSQQGIYLGSLDGAEPRRLLPISPAPSTPPLASVFARNSGHTWLRVTDGRCQSKPTQSVETHAGQSGLTMAVGADDEWSGSYDEWSVTDRL